MTTTLLVLLAVVAGLTAAGMTVRSVSRFWLWHWVEQRLAGSPQGDIYLERPQRLLLAAGTGNALAVFAGGALIGAAYGSVSWELALRLVGAALVVLVVGQVLPRAIARRWPARLAPVLLPPLRVVDLLIAPIRPVARAAARLVTPAPPADAPRARDSVEELLREGALEGVGETGEIAIITGVVQFGEKTAGEVMTPRSEVFALDVGTPPAELARRVASSAYSRVPLYRGTLDDVVGMVHAFDVFKAAGGAVRPRPVATAASTKPCNELLFEMLRNRRHLAVVQDEERRTLGIVTLEDLLEELVGDIRDEHDEPLPAQDAPPSAA
jgi:putative hemolysin